MKRVLIVMAVVWVAPGSVAAQACLVDVLPGRAGAGVLEYRTAVPPRRLRCLPVAVEVADRLFEC